VVDIRLGRLALAALVDMVARREIEGAGEIDEGEVLVMVVPASVRRSRAADKRCGIGCATAINSRRFPAIGFAQEEGD
jgi:hypothetical protein